ncbi:MAG: hypothetical protein ACRDTU_21955 [Micromonosporaceae bacterium]
MTSSVDVTVGPDSRLVLHQLVVRESDDDPDVAVLGRADTGEFIELPALAAAAVELLGQGRTPAEAEAVISARHDVELDAVELSESLIELAFVASVDGRPLPGPATRKAGSHLPWLKAHHVRWLVSWPAAALWCAVLVAAVVTWWRQPELLMRPGDFYWTDYVGLAVLVNTVLFSINVSVHELMHLSAARAFGAPARIGFATRLHHLVVQTDVSAMWASPRRFRYRVYLAGMAWDSFVVGACTVAIAYAKLPPLVDRLLGALTLLVVLSLITQTHVYMRVDLYYVLMEWLRCGNLFHDGWAYMRYLARRLTSRGGATDPTAELPHRERWAVKIYAVAMAIGSAIALGSFGWFGLPILIQGALGALAGIGGGFSGGSVARAIDGAAIIAVEGTLQVMFVVTFLRRHRHWWRRRRGLPATGGTDPAPGRNRG